MKKRTIAWIAAGAFAFYLLMLFILTAAESGADGAVIHTMRDALWYSLVTLTTVGYGDLYPVTAAGRWVGAVFSLMSTGLLALLLGLAVTFVVDKWFPAVYLAFHRNAPWMILTGPEPLVLACAANFRRFREGTVVVVPGDAGAAEDDPDLQEAGAAPADSAGAAGKILRPSLSVEQILARKGRKTPVLVCLLGDKEGSNIAQAIEYRAMTEKMGLSGTILCRAFRGQVLVPAGIVAFDDEVVSARRFWRAHGLREEEKKVVVIGPPECAGKILEQGLLMNVFDEGQSVRYDVFGAGTMFLREHFRLGDGSQTTGEVGQDGCSVMIADETGDRVCMHVRDWTEYPQMLQGADRIILCSPDEAENLRVLATLRMLFNAQCRIYVRVQHDLRGVKDQNAFFYGSLSGIYTPEQMLGDSINECARRLHGIYCSETNNASAWEKLNEFQKASNTSAADHLLEKERILLQDDSICEVTPGICRRAAAKWQELAEDPEQRDRFRKIEHMRWVRFHLLHNWSYAPVRDDAARRHPLLVPFEMLSEEDRQKDDYAWQMLGELYGTQ